MGFKKNHPFKGSKVYFATKHGKEDILAPLFSEIGIECVPALVDTDQFGTFSGEIERSGTIQETLRKKILCAAEAYPQAEFLVASEGSFAPDPFLGSTTSNLESLLFWNRNSNTETFVESLSLSPMAKEVVIEGNEEVKPFLRDIGFSKQAVIVRPEGATFPIFKGVTNELALEFAIRDCLRFSDASRVIVSTDQRACFNPTRRKAISEVGSKLITVLKCLCPECSLPGFKISDEIPGLPCTECDEPTQNIKSVKWNCANCNFELLKPRPDGKTAISPWECEYCNP